MNRKPIVVKLRPNNPKATVVVFGNRDPRGYDNKIEIWLDEEDKLHIQVMKPDLCYRFKEVKESPSYIEVIQE